MKVEIEVGKNRGSTMNHAELLADYVHRTTHSDYDWLKPRRRFHFLKGLAWCAALGLVLYFVCNLVVTR